MSDLNKVQRTQRLLSEALTSVNQCGTNKHLLEAKVHVRQALLKLEQVSKDELKKKRLTAENNSKQWWNDIVAHAPYAQMSQQAAMKTLKELDKMFAEQQTIIDGLENKVAEQLNPEIMND